MKRLAHFSLRWLEGCLFALLCGVGFAWGGTVVVVPGETHIPLSSHMALYHDLSGSQEIAVVAAQGVRFRPVGREELIQGFQKGNLWLRVTLQNPSGTPAQFWLALGHPRVQFVSLCQRGGEAWSCLHSGTRVPLASKPVPANRAVFPLRLEANESREILLQVKSDTAIDMEVSLWDPMRYLAWEKQEQLAAALATGGIALSGFLSLVAFVLLRERPYLYFSLMQLLAAMLEVARTGMMQQYLWPADQPFLSTLLPIYGGGSLLCLMLFVRDFLNLRQNLPQWARLLSVLNMAIGAAILLCTLDYRLGVRLVSMLTLVGSGSSVLLTLTVWRQGFRPARFLMLAFGVFLLGESIRQLVNLGLVAWPWAMNLSLPSTMLLATPLIMSALSERSRKLAEQLFVSEQVSLAKSEFLARISHELHSPLNTIIGYARMLGRGSARLPVSVGAADIEKCGLRLLGIVDELLLQSSVEAGKFFIELKPVALEAWLDELVRAAHFQAEAVSNDFVFERSSFLPSIVLADGARLRQVLDNLLTNANRHTHHGRVSLACRVETLASAGQTDGAREVLRFSVTDSGVGISEADQKRIFLPFVQLSSGERSGEARCQGVGMGLFISRELVRQMGGELDVVSHPGAGSVFSLFIPCRVQALVHGAQDGDAVKDGEATHSLNAERLSPIPLRILLIEDDPKSRLVISEQLASAGMIVSDAESGEAACARFQPRQDGQWDWDVILTDQMMDGGDGWFVLRNFRRLCPDLPVVLLSSAEPLRPTDCPEGLDFDAVLSKSVTPSVLIDTLIRCHATKPHRVVADSNRPGGLDASLDTLQSLVRNGEVTAIEAWADWAATVPGRARLASEIRQAVIDLDFLRLENLVSKALAARQLADPPPGYSKT